VDDEPLLLETRALILKSEGYSTVAASNGSLALQIFERISPDLVILDYAMPEMNGHEAALQMRSRNPEIPLMLLSAYMDLPQSVTSCFDVYVTKGEEVPVFLSHVARLLNLPRSTDKPATL
jgi:CheY-like chemotaxis protein